MLGERQRIKAERGGRTKGGRGKASERGALVVFIREGQR